MLEPSRQLIDRIYARGVSAEMLLRECSEDLELTLTLLEAHGLSLVEHKGLFRPKKLLEDYQNTIFCIVDIETNGSKLSKDDVIEIGAVKVQNGRIIARFDSLIFTETLPFTIAQLTGIGLDALKKAPHPKEVMHDFKLFLEDHIFVAHALKFDYNFISEMFKRTGLGAMLNPGLCTIDLAERTLSSAKYGLSYLNKSLHLDEDFKQHRAYNDALITSKLLQIILAHLPPEVVTVKELFDFSKQAKKMPRAPLIEEEIS